MPSYDYRCGTCGKTEEVTHRISEDPVLVCSDCGGALERQVCYSGGGFIIRGGTSSIHWKEKRLQTKKNEEAGERMKKRYGDSGPKARPNIAGVAQESWSDCQKLAKECGMNTASYQPLVDKEKKNKIQVVRS